MIVDVTSNDAELDRTAQIAIVGAGPAGLTLARGLSGVANVLVIESGGLEDDAALRDLLVGECAGLDYPLTQTRALRFGGSSVLWAGYCAIFDDHDFAARDWVPCSGWPFAASALKPYYAKVARILNIRRHCFDAREVARRRGVALPFDDEVVVPTVWRFGTPIRRFGSDLRGESESSGRIDTLLHAHVVDIRLDASHGSAKHLVIRTLDGREGRVSAEIFVLACGGIETPRLLLNANTQVPAGVGNSSGAVGRFFMEHPHRTITPLAVADPGPVADWAHRGSFGDGQEYLFAAGLSASEQLQARILNSRAHVFRTPAMREDEPPKVGLFMEQSPNPDSRITLADSTDALGRRRARLDWQLCELDWLTYVHTATAIGRAFQRAGAGRMTAALDTSAREREPVLHSNHHLGTTRMSVAPAQGVVDADCRMHDIENLYVVGGSVFPTVSWANPTFTVLALTLRLADHLKRRLGGVAD